MVLTLLPPRKALNKAFLKVKPSRSEIERFKKNLIGLLDGLDETESEEHNKNDLGDFLKNTFYSPKFYINTKGRNDLVIHTGPDSKSAPGILIEVKKPGNKGEMVHQDNLNAKAFQELILYYLRERITSGNLEIKHLIATNVYEWYIFDATYFEKTFAQNKALVKQFSDFEEGRLAGTTTDFFYNSIAESFISGITSEISFTYFDFRQYDKPLRNEDKTDDSKLISLFKVLSPEHLLKLPFSNDSNTLDKTFYSELLHIIGLTETKAGSKKLIERKKEGSRDAGSLLENTILQLDTRDKISRLSKPLQFGETNADRLFNVSLELVITWLNRILFLKLLEAQLIRYHKGDPEYGFLTNSRVNGFDDLDKLFFRVLARKQSERDPSMAKSFSHVPYLNSSLFEPTELEQITIFISNLEDNNLIPIISSTVLKDNTGKKRTGKLSGLQYLFEFLDSYDFAGEGSEEIQEDNKTLINASVLGLIFEKLNGYKDGSFFTPGFITMYMCRETIRRAVVQKFNEVKGWNCDDINKLYDKINDKQEANRIINSLKICDPAVGSGHFLVSALNEIIAIKSDLRILTDREGRRLKEYRVEVVNDELVITDEEGDFLEYIPGNNESQRIQEALFHEKQTIIENCLFGVDINPNSVKICRLRLWIELLKSAYYKADKNFTELETLPNIDINIKCGNSLISRYALDADIKQALKKSKWSIDSYRVAVMSYRNATNKEEKRTMERLIELIKTDFETEVAANDKRLVQVRKLNGDLFNLTQQTSLFDQSKKEKDQWNKKVKDLTSKIQKLESELEEIKSNKIYENAFEWRFEFPEVLNNEGDFVGFDVVIGNPPYGVKDKGKTYLELVNQYYPIARKVPDSYFLFMIKASELLKSKGLLSLIVPNTFCDIEQGIDFRRWLLSNNELLKIYDSSWVFEDAIVDTLIYFQRKSELKNDFISVINKNLIETLVPISVFEENPKFKIDFRSDQKVKSLLTKVENASKPLREYAQIKAGVKLYEKGKGSPPQDENILKSKPFTIVDDCPRGWRSLIRGGDINRYLLKPIKEYVNYGEWLAAPRDKSLFSGDRLIMRRTDDILRATFLKDDSICANSCHLIMPDDIKTNKIILALINSQLFQWIYNIKNPQMVGKIFAEIKVVYVEELPVRIPDEEKGQQLQLFVDQILILKKSDPSADTTYHEAEIDRLIYEVYGLTEEEIRIVEGN